MSGKLEYLEKYSIAPSPSRDYYGLRVSNDQVTLYLWRISHGPHKTPIVRTSGFADFKQDLRLQDEIQRIFGEYLLKHVENITSGKNTLVTLPKCLISKLIKYLTVQDITKLTSLSRICKEVFDDNSVWETLYKKYTPVIRYKHEKFHTIACNWKQLFQLAQIQGLMNEQKMLRARTNVRQKSANPKIESSARANTRMENPMKLSISNTKISSKVIPLENPATKKATEIPRRRNPQSSVSRKLSDNRLNESTIDGEKVTSDKKTPVLKSLQVTGQKNIKSLKEQSIVRKIEPKREVDSKDSIGTKVAETKVNKIQSKAKRIDAKSSNVSIKMVDDKMANVKTKSLVPTKVSRTEKPAPRSIQGDQGKAKSKGKTKKIGHSKSTILSTSTDILNDRSPVKDDSFDLADLIEASLKNIRSPRSIFDYDFSCIEKPKSCGGDTSAQDITRKMADHPRALKSGHAKATLDRLSEKSEPLTAKSIDSVNRSELSRGSVTPKYPRTFNTQLKKSTELNKNRCNVTVPEEKVDLFERYGIYSKYPTPRMPDSMEARKPVPRKEVDKMALLRSLGTKTLHGKTVAPNNAETIRYDLGKTMNNVYKYL
ncbi:F-box only protein 36 [Eufriesea mexicana]|uniref:F-box only protein 36 n=1 Tax=Eufriesea mexicana TaxID=516756 RepID=A0A310SCF9_9HYME|nr:PREDICTED: uncharacterized protein LOC108551045 [Eufriesea mexicana]OAD54994.1 F-box only protein 36 [Eufriesea mexicana]